MATQKGETFFAFYILFYFQKEIFKLKHPFFFLTTGNSLHVEPETEFVISKEIPADGVANMHFITLSY